MQAAELVGSSGLRLRCTVDRRWTALDGVGRRWTARRCGGLQAEEDEADADADANRARWNGGMMGARAEQQQL